MVKKLRDNVCPSIEEKIGLRMMAVGIGAMAITVLCMLTVFYAVLRGQVQADLRFMAKTAARLYENQGIAGMQAVFDSADIRVTVIDAKGEVLYESRHRGEMENHGQRKEVVQAVQHGEGFAQRRSKTSGYDTFYYALPTPEGAVVRTAMDARNYFSLYAEFLPAAIICLLAVLLLSGGTAVLLTRRLVRPILQMSGAINMGQAVQAPYRELDPLARALEADRGLREETEQMRREFTANVSHELKTPLTSISGYAELIESGMAKPEDVAGFAGRIQKEAARLLALIGDILELARLESGGAKADERVPVDLCGAARAVSQRLQMNAQRAYVTLECRAAESEFIWADARLVDELLQNLTDNAIRYNRPGGRVTLTVERLDEEVVLTVADTGLGIAPEHHSHIFERFYRVDKSRSKATGGTGLGLAIVKHIALLHDAAISLDSQVGEGTRIEVRFALYRDRLLQ